MMDGSMINVRNLLLGIGLVGLIATAIVGRLERESENQRNRRSAAGRQVVVFWHFWGGPDRDVVDDVARRFNQSQSEYFVRPVAMPGNNLQAKLFLAVTGGDPPDLVNQDDPILAEWAARGVLEPMDQIAPASELERLSELMFESAARLSTVDGRFYGVCNGLDIRALYYNQTMLEKHGLVAPETTEQLDKIARAIAPFEQSVTHDHYGYLPDSRRLWAWGYAFGGEFYDEASGQVIADSANIVRALEWMRGYSQRYGADNLAAFRQGDQSLPGKTFPLLPVDDNAMEGRYAIIMDGQWRTRDIRQFKQARKKKGIAAPEFGVCPLPRPAQGRANAGWVNGNFFLIPKGAKSADGAWEFIKFWIGMDDPASAAMTCAAGGWIPVTESVVQAPEFQKFLNSNPLFQKFVDLAASPNQFPTPVIPGAAMFKRTVESAAAEAMTYPDRDVKEILRDATQRIQAHLDRGVQNE